MDPKVRFLGVSQFVSRQRLQILLPQIHVSGDRVTEGELQKAVPDKIDQLFCDILRGAAEQIHIHVDDNIIPKRKSTGTVDHIFHIVTDRVFRQILLIQVGDGEHHAQVRMLRSPAAGSELPADGHIVGAAVGQKIQQDTVQRLVFGRPLHQIMEQGVLHIGSKMLQKPCIPAFQ